jgi:hypothetical protein
MSRPARQLAALRRRHSKECAVCGKGFKAIAKARYCSNACRQRAKYARSKLETASGVHLSRKLSQAPKPGRTGAASNKPNKERV